MNESDLFDRVIGWLLARSGLPVIIRDHLGKPRPLGSYGLLNLIRSDMVQKPAALEYDANPIAGAEPFRQLPVIEWEHTFSFNVYAPGATDYARRVETAGSVQAGTESLLPLTLFRTSPIRRLPELIGQVWEDRVQMDLFVREMARDGVPVDSIEHVPVEFEANKNRSLDEPDLPELIPVGSITIDKP